MKFYVISGQCGETIGCETTLKEARRFAESYGIDRSQYTIEKMDVEVTAETVRRLLGDLGGYVKATKA